MDMKIKIINFIEKSKLTTFT